MSRVRSSNHQDRLVLAEDRVGRWHAFPQPSAQEAVRRFDQLREYVVNLAFVPLGSPALPLLCLVLLVLVLRMEDLVRAWGALVRPLAWQGDTFVSWIGEGDRWQRRYPDPRTLLAAAAMREGPSFEVAATAASEALRRTFPSWRGDYTLDDLMKDGAVWAHSILPPYLAFSVTGICPLACLPDRALARESARAALAPAEELPMFEDAPAEVAPSDGEEDDLWSAIDAALVCEDGTDLHQRRTIVRGLKGLWSRFPSLTDGAYLVLAWCVELIETGTPTTSPIRASTGSDYVRRIGQGLLERVDAALAGLDDPLCWVVMYTDLIERADEGSRHKAHAALSAFHDFAVAQVDAPRLKSITSAEVDVEPPPRANVLWPHEIDWVWEQLGGHGSIR